MRDFIAVKDNPYLVRDTRTNAILNINVKGQEAYRKQREERLKIKKMLDEFDDVKNDINEIKTLLQELLNK